MEIHLAGNFPSGFKEIVGKVYASTPAELENHLDYNDKYLIAVQIFLAGGVTGNLNAFWKEYMNIYLAGCYSRENCLTQAMQKFLSKTGEVAKESLQAREWQGISILETFYYLQNNSTFPKMIKDFGSFLLDSGAFTFMSNTGSMVDFDKYVEDYAAFINKWNVERFFELDIDSVVGLKEVERLRDKLERLTGKQPIPVWHRTRGKEYFLKMCDAYPYVALGGIVTKEIPIMKYETLFPWFIQQAHKRGAKIHGLGYTNLKGLHKYHFDSVDSTAWLYGNRGGFVYRFNAKEGLMEKTSVPQGMKMKSKEAAVYNFNEWVRFQKYARVSL